MLSARRLALLGLLLVAACGFEPMYGANRGNATRADMQEVSVGAIANRNGQLLHRYINDRIHDGGGAPSARYALEINLVEAPRQHFGIQRDLTATYARLQMTAYFNLREIKTGQVLLTGSVNALSSYNVASDPFNTVVAENDARERAVRSLGDDVISRVSFYLRNPSAGKT
jgi:LPS-assembly lipoprotein